MHIVDGIILIILVASMVYYFWRGFVSAGLTWIGLFSSFLMIVRYGPMVKHGIMVKFSMSDFFSTVLAYFLILVMITILIFLLRILLNYLVRKLKLTFLNRVLGVVFGFLNVFLVVILLVLFINFVPKFPNFKSWLNESATVKESNRVYHFFRYDMRANLPAEYFK